MVARLAIFILGIVVEPVVDGAEEHFPNAAICRGSVDNVTMEERGQLFQCSVDSLLSCRCVGGD